VSLQGDAYLVPGFGIHLDGDGDRIDITGDNTYAEDAEFTLSMWFTKATCNQAEDYEMLYTHTSDETMPINYFREIGTCTATNSTADPAPDCSTGFQEVDSSTCPSSTCTFTPTTTSGIILGIGCRDQRSRYDPRGVSSVGGSMVRNQGC
jgi:hypothetical protein